MKRMALLLKRFALTAMISGLLFMSPGVNAITADRACLDADNLSAIPACARAIASAKTRSARQRKLLLHQARVFYLNKIFRRAIGAYARVLVIDPRSQAAHWGRGRAYFKIGKFRRAIIDLSYVVDTQSSNVEALLLRAAANHAIRRYDAAQADCTRAIMARSQDARGFLCRARANYRRGHLKDGLSDASIALLLKPNCIDCLLVRGAIYEAVKQSHQAALAYRSALMLEPDNRRAQQSLRRVITKR